VDDYAEFELAVRPGDEVVVRMPADMLMAETDDEKYKYSVSLCDMTGEGNPYSVEDGGRVVRLRVPDSCTVGETESLWIVKSYPFVGDPATSEEVDHFTVEIETLVRG